MIVTTTWQWHGYDITTCNIILCCTKMASRNAFGSCEIWWGVTWYGLEWCDVIHPVVMRCEVTRNDTEWKEIVRHVKKWSWYDMIMIWHGARSHLIAQYHTASSHNTIVITIDINIATAIVMIIFITKFMFFLLNCYDNPSDLKGNQCHSTSPQAISDHIGHIIS